MTDIVTASTVRNILISFVAVVLAFMTAALLLAAAGQNALESFAGMASTAVGSTFAIGTTLTKAVPRLLPALGIALALRAGLWNIGAEGQVYLGAAAAAAVALFGPQLAVPARHGARPYRGHDGRCRLGRDPRGLASLPRLQ